MFPNDGWKSGNPRIYERKKPLKAIHKGKYIESPRTWKNNGEEGLYIYNIYMLYCMYNIYITNL